ncbi:TetR/AcrR family transcriptional regulator [Solicola sp. PLA-1-18]|uniref:TetR/AcrR family transcriptional regulator n=1 Tax=Solicola sp. PLA-1-18 TaxID=3380532 RepID=UPI003B771BD6
MPRARDPHTRTRILDAAVPLFYERGVQAVGMAELAAAAACGKNAMYREFATKDGLVLAYLRLFGERRRESERLAVTGAADPRDAIRAIALEVVAKSDRPGFRGCPLRNYLSELGHADDEVSLYAEQWLRERRATVQSLVRETEVPDPEVVADQVWLALEGLWSSAAYPDRRRLGEAALRLIDDLMSA